MIFYASIDSVLENDQQFNNIAEIVEENDQSADFNVDGQILFNSIKNMLEYNKDNSNLRLFQEYLTMVDKVNQISSDNPESLIDVKLLLPNCMDLLII